MTGARRPRVVKAPVPDDVADDRSDFAKRWDSKIIAALSDGRGVGSLEQRRLFAQSLRRGTYGPTILEATLGGIERQDRRSYMREMARRARQALSAFEKLDALTRRSRVGTRLFWESGGRSYHLDAVRTFLTTYSERCAEAARNSRTRWNAPRSPLDILLAECIAEHYRMCFGKWPGNSHTADQTPFERVCEKVEHLLRELLPATRIAITSTARDHGVRRAKVAFDAGRLDIR